MVEAVTTGQPMTIVATRAYRPAPKPTPDAIAKAAGDESLARSLAAALAAPFLLLGSTLAELLSRGDDDPSSGIDWSGIRRRLLRVVRPALADVALRGMDRARADIGVSFDLVPARALAVAEAHASELVDGITATARDAVRAIIVRGLREGRSVDQVTADVRDVIGLHPRWANAVANRRRALESAKTPMSAARIDRLVGQYRSRLLTHQARTIARTELLRASNMGAMEGYRAAVAAGVYPDGVVRVWVTAPEFKRSSAEDGRICLICRPMSGVEVEGLTEPFQTLAGPVLHPPAHPNCRCRLIVKSATPRRSAA